MGILQHIVEEERQYVGDRCKLAEQSSGSEDIYLEYQRNSSAVWIDDQLCKINYAKQAEPSIIYLRVHGTLTASVLTHTTHAPPSVKFLHRNNNIEHDPLYINQH